MEGVTAARETVGRSEGRSGQTFERNKKGSEANNGSENLHPKKEDALASGLHKV